MQNSVGIAVRLCQAYRLAERKNMRIQIGIVGVPNVTIEAIASQQEMLALHEKRAKQEKPRAIERDVFDAARVRFAQQGATETRYFMA